jgi:diguanylate cyclase (GGDEF)-like protein
MSSAVQGPDEVHVPDDIARGVAELLLTDAPVPTAVLTPDLRHIVVNQALARLYGVPPQAATGRTLADLLGPMGVQIGSRCRSVALGGAPQLGHVVNGCTAQRPDSEAHWQIDCMPVSGVSRPGALMLVVTDITARTRAMRSLNEQRRILAYQASHDVVTGLANRFQLLEVLDHNLSSRSRPTVMLVDLDGFKQVNDVHGHAAGDHVLAGVANRLRDAVREDELVARYGGDEFVLVLRTRDQQAANDFAEALAARVREPIVWHGISLTVDASIGIALARDGDSAGAMLHRADKAMYSVKSARGRL